MRLFSVLQTKMRNKNERCKNIIYTLSVPFEFILIASKVLRCLLFNLVTTQYASYYELLNYKIISNENF